MDTENKFKLFLALVLALFNTNSFAFEGLFSDHDQLKNKVIVEIGNVKEINPPYGTQWSSKVYVLKSRCFTTSGFLSVYGSESAMMVYGKDKLVELAVFEKTISDLKVEMNYITLINCPESAFIPPSCDGLSTDDCRKILNAYEKKLQLQLEKLKR